MKILSNYQLSNYPLKRRGFKPNRLIINYQLSIINYSLVNENARPL